VNVGTLKLDNNNSSNDNSSSNNNNSNNNKNSNNNNNSSNNDNSNDNVRPAATFTASDISKFNQLQIILLDNSDIRA